MVEERRTRGEGNQASKADVGKETGSGGGQTEAGGAKPFINDRGEVCIGNECFNLAVDADRGEIRVSINREECGAELQETLDELHQVLGRGGRTVFETRSEPK